MVACRDGEPLLRRLFEPLGYRVEAEPYPSRSVHSLVVETRGTSTCPLPARDARQGILLSHLYVLLPVLDDDKHYWVARDEIEKVLARGGEWLAVHPETRS